MSSSPSVPDLSGAAIAFEIVKIIRNGLGKKPSVYLARVSDLGSSRARTKNQVIVKAFPNDLTNRRALEKESTANLKIGSCPLQANAVQELLDTTSEGSWPRCFGQMRAQPEDLEFGQSRFEPGTSNRTGLRCLVFEYVPGLQLVSRDHLTDEISDAIADLFEELHGAGVVFNSHIDHSVYPEVKFRNLYLRTNGTPFISDFQCASEAKLNNHGDKMKADEMTLLKDYLERMRDGKAAVDVIPREVQLLLESAA